MAGLFNLSEVSQSAACPQSQLIFTELLQWMMPGLPCVICISLGNRLQPLEPGLSGEQETAKEEGWVDL